MVHCAQTHLVEITVPVNGVPDLLTYSVPEFLVRPDLTGVRVRVQVGHRKVVGVVVNDVNVRCPDGVTPRPIDDILDESPIVTREQFALCRFVADYYFSPLGEVIRLCLPADTPRGLKESSLPKRRKRKILDVPTFETGGMIRLNQEQQYAVDQILVSSDRRAFLLQGITGSGKTEVYIHVAKSMLAQEKGVLVVVPEIALTPQLLARFESQLQVPIVMLHSGLTRAQRRESLFKLLQGQAQVTIGARSALFAPVNNLGLIVVDEEHDASLKQDETPRYHGRDVALWRAHHEGAKIILGSATPSLESRVNVERAKLHLLKLKQRATANSTLPIVEIVDLKSRAQHQPHRKKDRAQSDGQGLCILSGPLREAMTATLAKGEQVMLFLNRRGYAAFALCDACGGIVQCPNCSIAMTYYQKHNLLRCHQCDHSEQLPSTCRICHEGPILCLGLGTERIEAEVQLCFPDAKIARLDRDVARQHKKVNSILSDMQSNQIDILIGTQMIAKGHDFPSVSLVGVILADTALAMPDFRAAERTFQLLTQVAGRAGRRDQIGKVIVQTFNPNHPAIQFVQNHDVDGFAKLDADQRREAKQPPFVRSALLRVEALLSSQAEKTAHFIRSKLSDIAQRSGPQKDCSVLGPAPAPIERLRGKSRWHLYLRTSTTQVRSEVLLSLKHDASLQQVLKREKSRLVIDIDPIQML